MAAVQQAKARQTRSAGTRPPRPTEPQQRSAQKQAPRTATLHLPLITLQVRIPRVRMPDVNLPDVGEMANKVGEAASDVANTVKSNMPPPTEMAYFAGLGVMGLLDIIEWPIALAL